MTDMTAYEASLRQVIAHDSGDGETIFHCPFCGSGQVIARSDNTVECEFCHTNFTVQVQPEFSAFPQTINGQPVQVPGMPGQVNPPGTPPGGADPMGGDPMGEAPMDPSQVGDPAAPQEDPNEGFSGKPGPDNQPPWLRGAVRNEHGVAMSPEALERRIAFQRGGVSAVRAVRARQSR